MNDSRILVIGDSMLDTYWHGSSSSISPEAPIPVVKFINEEVRAGGAANVALGIKALGSNVTILSSFGNDEPGRQLRSILENGGVEICQHPGSVKTTNKLRTIVDGHQVSRIDFDYLSSSVKSLPDDLNGISVIVLSDYNKGILADCADIISQANILKIPVIVDPKGTDWHRYSGASLITPNEKELLNYLNFFMDGQKISREDFASNLDEIAFAACRRVGVEAILCTRGSNGMELFTRQRQHTKFSPRTVNVADVTGAGDTVVACIANCIDYGFDIVEGCRRSNIAASLAVEKMGTSIVGKSELDNALQLGAPWQKIIFDRNELLKICNDLKNSGLTVVFTNGCFDILHKGHVQYLEEAAKLGDVLIVALNNDESVRKVKGTCRPINDLDSRLRVVSALGCVSYVIPFAEETPIPLIELLKPHTLVKGGDYKSRKDIIGHDVVEKYGGQAVLLSSVPDISTSSIIRKINLNNTD